MKIHKYLNHTMNTSTEYDLMVDIFNSEDFIKKSNDIDFLLGLYTCLANQEFVKQTGLSKEECFLRSIEESRGWDIWASSWTGANNFLYDFYTKYNGDFPADMDKDYKGMFFIKHGDSNEENANPDILAMISKLGWEPKESDTDMFFV